MRIKKEKIIEIAWVVIVVALFILSIKMIRSGELQTQVASFGIFAPLVVIVLKSLTLIIAPLGGTPLYVLSGALFGGVKGFIICFLGDVLGSLVCFWISRRYGEKVVRFFTQEKMFNQVKSFLNLLGQTKSFLKARIALFSLPEIFAYAAGLSSVNFWKFILIHSVFMLPLSIVGVFFGSQLANLTLKYSILAFLLPAIIMFGGLLLLYKDYQKTEGA